MKTLGQYDGATQMFIEEPRDPDAARLAFVRWLVEHGKLEHQAAGPSFGRYTGAAVDEDEDWPLAS